MKLSTYISFILIFIGCSPNENSYNLDVINEIDGLEETHKIIEVTTDSLGITLDTLSISYLKYDKEGNKRYKRTVRSAGSLHETEWINYYDTTEDVVLTRTYDEKGDLYSSFETTTSNEDLVTSAIQIVNDPDGTDTFKMDYSRTYLRNGNIGKLTINTNHDEYGTIQSVIDYNDSGKAINEYMIRQNDTMNTTIWIYSDTLLQQSIYTNYSIDTTRTIYQYDRYGNATIRDQYRNVNSTYLKFKSTKYQYDQDNQLAMALEVLTENKEFRYIKYIHVK